MVTCFASCHSAFQEDRGYRKACKAVVCVLVLDSYSTTELVPKIHPAPPFTSNGGKKKAHKKCISMNRTTWTNKTISSSPCLGEVNRTVSHRCKYEPSAAQFLTLPLVRHLSEQREDCQKHLDTGSRAFFFFFHDRSKSVLIRQCFGKHFSLKREIRESVGYKHLVTRL